MDLPSPEAIESLYLPNFELYRGALLCKMSYGASSTDRPNHIMFAHVPPRRLNRMAERHAAQAPAQRERNLKSTIINHQSSIINPPGGYRGGTAPIRNL